MPKSKMVNKDVIYLSAKSEELEFYIEWAGMPSAARGELKTQVKLAAHLGVTEQTIRNWKRDPRIQERVDRIQASRIRLDQYPNIVDSLYVQATDPQNSRSVAAAKLLLDVMHRSIDSVAAAGDLQEMSLKELKELAAGLYDELDDRQADAASSHHAQPADA